jgi:hypothetical protein
MNRRDIIAASPARLRCGRAAEAQQVISGFAEPERPALQL